MILDTQLSQLENSQLIRRSDEPDLTYLFKHTLTQETAYESLLQKRRREIHRRVAQSYEEFYPDRLDEFAPLLAQHYGAAGEDEKTLEYEIRAGDVAARKYANAEAIAHYSRALEIAKRTLILRQAQDRLLASSPSTREREGVSVQDLYLKRGRALELSGKYAEALANYDEMEGAARTRGDRALELASLLARATLRATPTPVHDPARGRLLLDQALALARELVDSQAEAKGFWTLMLLSKFSGRPREAVEYGEQALALARKYNLREQMAFTLNDLGAHAYEDIGQFRRALSALDEARQLWRELGNQPMLADTFGSSAIVHSMLGEFAEALQAIQEARSISDRIGNQWGQSYSRFIEGNIYAERGEVDHAITVMEECIELGEEAGFLAPSVWVRTNLAMLYGTMGSVELGIELVQLAGQSAEAHLSVWRAWPLAVLARLELLRGRINESEQALTETHLGSEADYITDLFLTVSAAVALARAELALARGDHTSALTVMDELLAQLDKTGGRLFLSEAQFVKAQALLAAGQLEQASEVLTAARGEAQALGSRRMLWQILAAMSKIEAQRGDEAQAAELQSQAREVVEYIREHSPPDLRDSFLNLPQIRILKSEFRNRKSGI